VPNGTLFGDGIAARIKEDLLKHFNLHTVVRLPNGVFAPYTGIPTNILFFNAGQPTRTVWYYEQPLSEGIKNYTKTRPMAFEEFAPLLAWWRDRCENERAWQVAASDLLKYGEDGILQSVNLDVKNPNRAADLEHLPPEELVKSIVTKERQIAEIMDEIERLLNEGA
jgi:type I restriction enzyme M protein